MVEIEGFACDRTAAFAAFACDKTAPIASRLQSVVKINDRAQSGSASTGAEHSACFTASKAATASAVQTYGTLRRVISSGGGSSLPQGLFIQTGAMRPAAAFSCSSAGVQGRRNSSNSSAAAQPYKQALTSEAVDLSVAEQMRVGGDIAGAGVEFVVHSGCGHSVVSLAQAQDLVSVLGKLGSSCALISLDDPLCVGMFAGPIQVPATHVLRSVPVGLGLGVYPQHFLVMEGANFPITLGLDFCNTYGAKIFSRSWHNRQYKKPWAYRKGHKD